MRTTCILHTDDAMSGDWLGNLLGESTVTLGGDEATLPSCNGILIVNDFSDRAVRLIQRAIAERNKRSHIEIALLTRIGREHCAEDLARSIRALEGPPFVSESEAKAIVEPRCLRVTHGRKSRGVTFEYDV